MPALRKAKHYWVSAAKVLVLVAAVWVIWQKLSDTSQAEWLAFLLTSKSWPAYAFPTILLLSIANRVLEIYKWRNLAGTLQTVSWNQSAQQVLAALTAGIFTPNGIGEYGAKALYYPKPMASRVLILNLVCNGIQMCWSIVLGLTGLIYFNACTHLIPQKTLLLLLSVPVILGVIFFSARKIQWRGYSLSALFAKIREIPKAVHERNVGLGFLRYLSFSLQYLLFFRLFGCHASTVLLLSGIAAVYLLASSLPSFQFLDFAVKGSVALLFFPMLGVNEWTIMTISTLMWVFNVVLPVLIGSYFVARFKPVW